MTKSLTIVSWIGEIGQQSTMRHVKDRPVVYLFPVEATEQWFNLLYH